MLETILANLPIHNHSFTGLLICYIHCWTKCIITTTSFFYRLNFETKVLVTVWQTNSQLTSHTEYIVSWRWLRLKRWSVMLSPYTTLTFIPKSLPFHYSMASRFSALPIETGHIVSSQNNMARVRPLWLDDDDDDDWLRYDKAYSNSW